MLKPTHSPHYSAPTLHAPHPLPTPKFSPHNFLTNPQLTISIYLYAYLRHACPIHHTAADRRCRSSVSGYPHTCTFGTFSTHYHYHYPHTPQTNPATPIATSSQPAANYSQQPVNTPLPRRSQRQRGSTHQQVPPAANHSQRS